MNAEESVKIAQFIEAARDRRRPKMSARKAADLADISEGWWRQLVAGGKRSGGVWAPAVGSAETLTAMAAVVGVSDEVRQMLGDEAPDSQPITAHDGVLVSDVAAAILRDTQLIEEARQHLLRQYELLRRLSPSPTSEARGKQSPRRTVDPSDVTRLRPVAHEGDPDYRDEMERRGREARKKDREREHE